MGDESQLGGIWREFFCGSLLVFLVLCGGLWTVPQGNVQSKVRWLENQKDLGSSFNSATP